MIKPSSWGNIRDSDGIAKNRVQKSEFVAPEKVPLLKKHADPSTITPKQRIITKIRRDNHWSRLLARTWGRRWKCSRRRRRGGVAWLPSAAKSCTFFVQQQTQQQAHVRPQQRQ